MRSPLKQVSQSASIIDRQIAGGVDTCVVIYVFRPRRGSNVCECHAPTTNSFVAVRSYVNSTWPCDSSYASSDQDGSFLAIRLLSSVIDEGSSLLDWYGIVDGELDVSIVPASLSKLLTGDDLTIDWESLDQLFLTWFMNLNDGSLCDETADMLVLAFR